MKELIDAYGLDVVQAYMAHIQVRRLCAVISNVPPFAQENAEVAVRDMLKEIAAKAKVDAPTIKPSILVMSFGFILTHCLVGEGS